MADDSPPPEARPLIPLSDEELVQTLLFAARQNRHLFSLRDKVQWWVDTRPDQLAKDQVRRMKLAGIVAFRRAPAPGQATPAAAGD